jgi:hypothetical protein
VITETRAYTQFDCREPPGFCNHVLPLYPYYVYRTSRRPLTSRSAMRLPLAASCLLAIGSATTTSNFTIGPLPDKFTEKHFGKSVPAQLASSRGKPASRVPPRDYRTTKGQCNMGVGGFVINQLRGSEVAIVIETALSETLGSHFPRAVHMSAPQAKKMWRRDVAIMSSKQECIGVKYGRSLLAGLHSSF